MDNLHANNSGTFFFFYLKTLKHIWLHTNYIYIYIYLFVSDENYAWKSFLSLYLGLLESLFLSSIYLT